MLVSTETGSLFKRYPSDIAVGMFKKAGFEALDFTAYGSMTLEEILSPFKGKDNVEKAKELRKLVESYGMTFNQAHAPFPQTVTGNDEIFKVVSALGAKNMVVHPIHNIPYHGNEERLFEINYNYYKSLFPICEEYNVRVCTENMWRRDKVRNVITEDFATPAEEIRLYDELSSPYFGICLDIGHCLLTSWDIGDSIRMIGKRLTALHIHDNDGKEDRHTALGLGITDIDAFLTALADIDYKGDYTLESSEIYNRLPESFFGDALDFMGRTALKARDIFVSKVKEKNGK